MFVCDEISSSLSSSIGIISNKGEDVEIVTLDVSKKEALFPMPVRGMPSRTEAEAVVDLSSPLRFVDSVKLVVPIVDIFISLCFC
jgi:hypothetical protein